VGRGKTRELFRNPGSVGIARLTGCKNISPVKITGDRELKALDWGLTLRTALPVDAGITHVGIRAHDFCPAVPVQAAADGEARGSDQADAAAFAVNRIRVRLTRRLEEPFEEVVLFTNADAKSPEEQGEIWWKFSKYSRPGIPEYLSIPRESLLLLHG
jgi:molybdate transport system ATP-binding protein